MGSDGWREQTLGSQGMEKPEGWKRNGQVALLGTPSRFTLCVILWWRARRTCTHELAEITCGSPSFARRLSLSKLLPYRPPEVLLQVPEPRPEDLSLPRLARRPGLDRILPHRPPEEIQRAPEPRPDALPRQNRPPL